MPGLRPLFLLLTATEKAGLPTGLDGCQLRAEERKGYMGNNVRLDKLYKLTFLPAAEGAFLPIFAL
jgi:hypothetical protein